MIRQYVLDNYLQKNKVKITLYIILVLMLFSFQSLGVPILISNLFKHLNKEKNFNFNISSLVSYFKEEISYQKIIILLIVIWIFILIFNIFKNQIEKDIIPRYLGYLRNLLFESIINKYSDRYDDIKIGDTLGRILDVSRNMKDCFQMIIVNIFPQIVALIITSGFILKYNTNLGTPIVILTIIFFVILIYFTRKILDTAIKREYNYALMNEKLSDNFSNLMNIYINNQQTNVITKNNKLEKEYTEILTKEYSQQGDLNIASSLIVVLIVGITFVYGIIQLSNKKINKNQLMTFILIMTFYIGYCINLSNDIPLFITKLGTVLQSKDFLNNLLTSNIKQIFDPKKNNIIKGNIEFKNVYFKYPKASKYILNNFSLYVKKGDRLGILGRSGSGKTTIMKLILKMHKANSGVILIEDEEIGLIDTEHIRKNITYVNQRTILFNDTVINNLKYGNKLNKNTIVNFLKKYELDSLYNKLDYKLDTMAGVNGYNLSLGMQKIIFICRGIFRGTGIIIFDEPLAGLDKKTREKVLNMIKNECINKTIIVITHDKEIIPYMTRIIYMDELLNLGIRSTNKEQEEN